MVQEFQEPFNFCCLFSLFPFSLEIGGMRSCWNICQEPGKTAYMGCIGDDEFGKKLTDACKKVGWNLGSLMDHSRGKWIIPFPSRFWATLFFTSWRFPKKIAGTRCNVDGIHSKIQQNTQGSSKKAMDQSLQRRVKRESYPCLLNLETEDSCLKKGRCWTWKNPSFSASEKSGWFILGLCILVASFRELKTYKSAVSHHFRDGFSESQIHVFVLEGWCGLQVHDRQSYPHRSLCGHHHEQGETCGLPEKWCQTCIFSPADRGVWVFGIEAFKTCSWIHSLLESPNFIAMPFDT